MKKICFLLLILIIPYKVFALSAASAIVIDQDSKRVLYSKNAYEPKLIASTTKIMTALVAIENSDINKTIKVILKLEKNLQLKICYMDLC